MKRIIVVVAALAAALAVSAAPAQAQTWKRFYTPSHSIECKVVRPAIGWPKVECVNFKAHRGAWVSPVSAGAGRTHARYAYLWKQWADGPALRAGHTFKSGFGVRCKLAPRTRQRGITCWQTHGGYSVVVTPRGAWSYR